MPRIRCTLFLEPLPRALSSLFSSSSLIFKSLSSRAFQGSNSPPPIRAPSKDPLYPKLYTSGRWLNRDEEQRARRYVDFDFQKLCEKVLTLCPEASHIISYEKKEGNYNKVLIFLFNNGKRIVARLPTPGAGPPTLTTNSEVATMQYVKANTTIPVPDVLDWSDDPMNPIGSEFIIMRHVEGVQLQQRWDSMVGSQYSKCVKAVCDTMKQLASLDFPAYGSLYFKDAKFDSSLKIPFSEGFCIGPHCSTTYWDWDSSQTKSPKSFPAGPWKNLSEYSSGIIANGNSKLPTTETEQPRPCYWGPIEEHLKLLQSAESILQALIIQPQIRNNAAPTLLHADSNARNIYVSDDDPSTVTCLIDWQSSSIEPAFTYAYDIPDFAMPPDNGEDPPPERNPPLTEKDVQMRKVAFYCNQTYEVCIKYLIPRLNNARSADQLQIRPFQYSNASWRDSTTAVRQEFIDLAEAWQDLGLEGKMPYDPSPVELELQKKNHRDFVNLQGLKAMLIKLLRTDSDGWVPIERWEETRYAHRKVYETCLELARSGKEDMNEEEVRELWPFDDVKNVD